MRADRRTDVRGCSWAVAVAAVWALTSLACGSGNGSGPRDAAAGSGGTATGSGGSGGRGGTAGASGGSVGTDGGGTDATDACAGDACVVDLCPDDSFKLEPGACGCGVLDTNSDTDDTPDCNDLCPLDSIKIAPGICGCTLPDDDTDHDTVLDCNDVCPKDMMRTTVVGVCGCGAADTLPFCLRHRYSFGGTGTTVTDSIATDPANGTVVNTMLAGDGTLVLAGLGTDQYVSLPAETISKLGESATFEAWITWTGQGLPWQRIFDFGSNDLAMPGMQGGLGLTYLFLTPTNTINAHLRLAFTNTAPPGERVVNGPTSLPWPTPMFVAVVIDGSTHMMTLYQGPAAGGTPPVNLGSVALLDTRVALLDDVNNWLGRSQFSPDEEFQGTYNEFRIYSAARTAAQIALDVANGPNGAPAP